MINPIKNNRIINDITFAIRLRDFIKSTDICDAISEEEKEYLLRISEDLLHYQIETATEDTELKYLKNIEDLI